MAALSCFGLSKYRLALYSTQRYSTLRIINRDAPFSGHNLFTWFCDSRLAPAPAGIRLRPAQDLFLNIDESL